MNSSDILKFFNIMLRESATLNYGFRHIALTLLMTLCSMLLFGQQVQTLKPQLETIAVKEKSTTDFIHIKPTLSISGTDLFVQHKTAFGLGLRDGMTVRKADMDQLGFTHFRYNQTLDGVPIVGAEYIVHERNGRVEKANGVIVENIQVLTTPSVPQTLALQYAMNHFNSPWGYAWASPHNEEMIKFTKNDQNATYYPQGELVVVHPFGNGLKEPENYVLAWKFDVYDKFLSMGFRYYINAISGEFVRRDELIHKCTNGTAQTNRYGIQTIKTTKISDTLYSLRDTCSTIQIRNLNWNNWHIGGAGNQPKEIFDNNNVWSESALKRSGATNNWLTERVMSYYQNVHARNSYDNNGGNVLIYTNALFWNNNAGVWYTQNATFAGATGTMQVGGDNTPADNDDWNPMDVIGHEVQHGVTHHSAGLIYGGESGALNESFSDIFGNAFERWQKGAVNWALGEDNTVVGAIRNMSRPKQHNQPNSFQGTNWNNAGNGAGTGIGVAVHRNSGVQNFWFYLLAMGGSGRIDDNPNRPKYSVKGIGFDKAEKIAYRNLTVYLNSGSRYADARTGAIEATKDLFGECSQEYISTINAWFAVGVGPKHMMFDSIALKPATCDSANGEIFVNVEGGTGKKDYFWFKNGSLLPDTTSKLINIEKGIYEVYVIDSMGCMIDTTIELKDSVNFKIRSFVYRAFPCGNNNGRISTYVSPVLTPVIYAWSNGSTKNQIDSLTQGTYSLTVTDTVTGCDWDTTFQIESPELEVSILGGGNRTFCQGQPQTPVTLNASVKNCPTCTFLWNTGETNASISVSASGNYTVQALVPNPVFWCPGSASTSVTFWVRDCEDSTQREWEIPIIVSRDPNDIIGPDGYGEKKWVSKFSELPYKIRFENDPEFATAPAQKVVVKFPIPAHANIFSFRLSDFGFGSHVFNVPPNRSFHTERLNLIDSLGIFVDVIAGINVVENEAFWILESIDPATGLPPADPMLGFLPVNDTATGSGEGFVSFTIKPANQSVTGDSLIAFADIYFDLNDSIRTPEVFNVIDAVAPTSSMSVASSTIFGDTVTLNWTAQDDPGGSGVRHVNFYVSINNGPFGLHLPELTGNSFLFTGTKGFSYSFYTLAVDTTYNTESAKTTGDVTVTFSEEPLVSICDSVRNNVAQNVTTSAAYLTWDSIPGAYRYQIRGKVLGAANWVHLQTKPNSPTWLKVGGLVNNTTYIWQVRAVCDQAGTDLGAYSELDTFRTGCFVPQNLTTSNITATSATISWTKVPGAAGYQIAAKVQGTQNWTIFMNAGSNSISRNFSGLSPGTTYRWTVRTWCDTAGVRKSDYAAVEMFSTLTAKEEANLTFAQDKVRIGLYPNPTNGRFKLEILLQEPSTFEVQIFDTRGALVYEEKQTQPSAEFNNWIDLKTAPSGLYLIRIETTSGVWFRKVVRN